MRLRENPTETDAAELRVPPALAALVDKAVETFDSDRAASREYLLNATILIAAQARRSPDSGAASGGAGLATWQIKRVLRYIEDNLGGLIESTQLAASARLSVSHMSRAFRTSFGVAPWQYVSQRRLHLACEKMRTTELSLAEIALACGLCDQSHLCRLFRRLLSVTPNQWRRENVDGSLARPTSAVTGTGNFRPGSVTRLPPPVATGVVTNA